MKTNITSTRRWLDGRLTLLASGGSCLAGSWATIAGSFLLRMALCWGVSSSSFVSSSSYNSPSWDKQWNDVLLQAAGTLSNCPAYYQSWPCCSRSLSAIGRKKNKGWFSIARTAKQQLMPSRMGSRKEKLKAGLWPHLVNVSCWLAMYAISHSLVLSPTDSTWWPFTKGPWLKALPTISLVTVYCVSVSSEWCSIVKPKLCATANIYVYGIFKDAFLESHIQSMGHLKNIIHLHHAHPQCFSFCQFPGLSSHGVKVFFLFSQVSLLPWLLHILLVMRCLIPSNERLKRLQALCLHSVRAVKSFCNRD